MLNSDAQVYTGVTEDGPSAAQHPGDHCYGLSLTSVKLRSRFRGPLITQDTISGNAIVA